MVNLLWFLPAPFFAVRPDIVRWRYSNPRDRPTEEEKRNLAPGGVTMVSEKGFVSKTAVQNPRSLGKAERV
jgi:hypothetical protein